MKFYGQYDLDKTLYYDFFNGKRNGFFVECGAYDGLAESTCKFFEESMGWSGLNIEPAPIFYEKLVQNRPNAINIQCALSNQDIVAKFKHVIHPKYGDACCWGSLKHVDWVRTRYINQKCSFVEYNVLCKSFSTILNEMKHPISKIDLFVLDVEGHELEAAESVLDSKVLPEFFCIEHSMVGIKNLNKLLNNKYKLVKVVRHNAFYKKGI